ncbi:MAG: hypothetical protein M3Y05_12115 [Gemmatimonadota bacterium]|nr:hypothetical protein [Gemmatimonadota bacterium]
MGVRESVARLIAEVEAGPFVEARIVREQYFLFPPGSTPPPETKKAG